jgi:hypothetical protein
MDLRQRRRIAAGASGGTESEHDLPSADRRADTRASACSKRATAVDRSELGIPSLRDPIGRPLLRPRSPAAEDRGTASRHAVAQGSGFGDLHVRPSRPTRSPVSSFDRVSVSIAFGGGGPPRRDAHHAPRHTTRLGTVISTGRHASCARRRLAACDAVTGVSITLARVCPVDRRIFANPVIDGPSPQV